MAKRPLQTSYANRLIANGFIEVIPSPTSKARCFEPPSRDRNRRIWLGRAGSVRIGPTYTNSRATSIID